MILSNQALQPMRKCPAELRVRRRNHALHPRTARKIRDSHLFS